MTEETLLALDSYIQKHYAHEDRVLREILSRSEAAGLRNIQLSPAQAKLLHLLVKVHGAKRILEVGTLGGYSGTWLARALPEDGKLITLEIDPHAAQVARENFAAAGLSEKVQLIEGDAIQTMKGLLGQGTFDFVFIDGHKSQYPEYYEFTMRMVRPGSLIVLDNVVQQGKVLDSSLRDIHHRKVRELNAFIGVDPRVEAIMVPTFTAKGLDGFLVVRVK
ncbi:O-methyltransferase [Deinococcus cellulosilyticus]|uniref:O-methyltransferase n=1 Tax=Deinococcus cellulosilyticus (strain DSM 18568 / NBRC 106333 / KACC 11606 / 5516J-15) TaxID=1223518 RepID=A0A511MX29_DEIC1|nr:O-methyltransferase [Deinococcus cellulosilyticus]GEM45142.1 O-methyltransferase [Deinococcus cellulosilyticus NBRC 106333 = KACC 11606]